MIIPFSFTVNGCVLCGIEHDTGNMQGQVKAVIMLSGPGTNRVGPHRLHLPVAAMLERKGYNVFRFDFRGRGESEGDPAALNVHSMIEDLLGMIRYVRTKYPWIKECMVIANCLSSVSAIKVFEKYGFISSCILLGAQEFDDGPLYLTRFKELVAVTKKYMLKGTRFENWKRLLKREVDLATLGKSVSISRPAQYLTTDVSYKKSVEQVLNELEPDLSSASRHLLFMYGSRDPLQSQLIIYRKLALKKGWSFHSAIIEDADRTFTDPVAAGAVLRKIDSFSDLVMPFPSAGQMIKEVSAH